MAPRAKYTQDQFDTVRYLLNEGHNRRHIADTVKLPPITIDNIRRKLQSAMIVQLTEDEPSPFDNLVPADLLLRQSNTDDPYFNDWLSRWGLAYKSAIAEKKLSVVVTLLNQYAQRLVVARKPEAVVEIQPVHYSSVLPPLKVSDLAEEMVKAIKELIVGTHLSQDQADILYSAMQKYYPSAKAHD
jgi:hypothetical protein